MGFLDRAIRRGISEGISDAIGNAVQKAVEPKATELANKAADKIDEATNQAQQTEKTVQKSGGFEGAMANLQRSVEGYATEAAKNMKVCPSCGEAATADKAFCPSCGAKLPDMTVADGAVCPSCGKQNTVGTKFCSGCGTKLPAAVAEEEARAGRDAAAMQEWDARLSQYPKWNCGGTDFCIEEHTPGYLSFYPNFEGNNAKARQAVESYRQLLLENGFREAGEYPSKEHLYKKVDGVCYHVDTEHCFDGDPDCPQIGFDTNEPSGGFDYVKPEPKKKTGIFDLFK